MSKKKKESNAGENLANVLDIIREIAEAAADGDYIYRGEPKCNPKVSSGLYREYEKEIDVEEFNIEIVQKEIIEEAKKHTTEESPIKILTQLQHYGGKTNLIDFTTDYLKALFFACDGSSDEDGRVILIYRDKVEGKIEIPRNPQNRIIAQGSIFIRPPKGLIEPTKIILIPSGLKQPILRHLEKYHGISTETIYNDLHGFIIKRRSHRSAYTEFYKGVTCQRKGDQMMNNLAKKEELYRTADNHYSKALEINPRLSVLYNNRGNVRANLGMYEKAIEDYGKAIEIDPSDADIYYNRGILRANLGRYEKAVEDYDKAIEINPKHSGAYNNRGLAKQYLGEFKEAVKDYDKAIEFDPNHFAAFYSRGISWLCLSKWDNAEKDLIVARDKGRNIVDTFHLFEKDIPTFEKKHNIKFPPEIIALLTPEKGKL